MKIPVCLLILGSILFASCSSQKTGCPASNYYTKEIKQQNRKAGKQMRLF
ncbi:MULTISPECIES: hypothetical protein [Chitinophaga]|nr:hypothetical protein [Chitinophaga ginsengisegetis]MDR6565874.1 hypothetical protein [Chitinophaga ginsengisegetis]MDR6645603.1 hypothetical protein [Chitinophaga ginsengisegetis]MDR6651805.1 hypothetical protein [Chitinophaga ginsengisegetis]